MQLSSAQLEQREIEIEGGYGNKDKGTSYKALLQYLVERGMPCTSTREAIHQAKA